MQQALRIDENVPLLALDLLSRVVARRIGASREEVCARAFEMITNTAPFDITHHPAMSVPCGMVDGLPVGLMLIGRHFDEPTIYRAAHAFEQSGDWKKM